MHLNSRNRKDLHLFTWMIPLILKLAVVECISMHGFCVPQWWRRQWLHKELMMLVVVGVVQMHAKAGRDRIGVRGVLRVFSA